MIVLKGKSQFTQQDGPVLPAPSPVEQAAMDLRPSLWIQPSPARVQQASGDVTETLCRAAGRGYRPAFSGAPRLVTSGSAHALRFGMEGAGSAPGGLAVPGGQAVMPTSGSYTAAYVVRMPPSGTEGTGTWPPELWASGGAVLECASESWYHVLNKTNGDLIVQQAGVTVAGWAAALRTGAWLSVVVSVKAGASGVSHTDYWKNGVHADTGPAMAVGPIAGGDRSVLVGGGTVNPFYGDMALMAIFPDVDAKTNDAARAAILDLCASVRSAVTA